nr:MAG TPA: hypothetical protein [Caudoviricetes sp.]
MTLSAFSFPVVLKRKVLRSLMHVRKVAMPPLKLNLPA